MLSGRVVKIVKLGTREERTRRAKVALSGLGIYADHMTCYLAYPDLQRSAIQVGRYIAL